MQYDFDELIDRHGTLCTKWDNLTERMGRSDVLAMWVADTDFPCAKPIQEAIQKRAAHPLYGYSFVPPAFFQAACGWMEKRHGWHVEPEEVRFFPGVVPFIGVALRALTAPGDRVLIQSPVYHPFAMMIRENGREVCSCPLAFDGERYTVDFEALDRALADAHVTMMILCSPHNPVGRVYTREELERISALCIQHGVILLADEIHSDVVYSGHKHIPVASTSPEAAMNTITCTSPSKAFNIAGLKASGIIIMNPLLRDKIDSEISRTHVSTPNAFAVAAYIAAYTQCEDYLDQMVAYLDQNRDCLDGWLRAQTPKIRLIPSEGTYLMWLDCTALGIKGDELHRFFLDEAHIAVNKGEIFGPEGANFVRLNIACPRQLMEKALGQLKQAYDKRFA